jgi:hypothetical protein
MQIKTFHDLETNPMPKLGSSSPSNRESATAEGWSEVAQERLIEWDRRLQDTSASIYQYPFWNEPFRRLYFEPKYLTYHFDNREIGFVCILTIGFLGIRIGLVRYGPVCLVEGETISREAWCKLELWAKHNGYIFLRITHADEKALGIVSSMAMSKRIDAFPLYPEESEELIVPQHSDDTQMMSALSHEVRRQITRAREVRYQIEFSESPGRFESVWPLFESMASRKEINSRPFAYYRDLMAYGVQAGCIRLYTASYHGDDVQAILVARAGKIAYLLAGALDVRRLQDNRSSSYLLHWHAMRDFFNLGTMFYHIGNRAGPVYQFKKKFNPVEIKTAPPVTLVTNRCLFFVWSVSVLKLGQPLLVRIRRIVQLRQR